MSIKSCATAGLGDDCRTIGKESWAPPHKPRSDLPIYLCAENAGLNLYEYLPWKRMKRRKKRGRKVHKSHIPQRVSIRLRPEAVNARAEFGHWEGDTIEGKWHRNGIHTEAERVSRLLVAKKSHALLLKKQLRRSIICLKTCRQKLDAQLPLIMDAKIISISFE